MSGSEGHVRSIWLGSSGSGRGQRKRAEEEGRGKGQRKRAEEERKKEQVKQVKLKGYGGLSSRISVDQIGWWVQVQSRGTLCQ